MLKKLLYTFLALSLFALVAGPGLAALPLTRSTTYVAGTTPAIKAADLNALQDYLSDIYSGLRSIKGLTVDGTGGTATTAPAGSVVVARATAGAGANTALAQGELAKGGAPLCWAKVQSDGTILRSYNVLTGGGVGAARTGVGTYTLTCNAQPASTPYTAAVVTVAKTTAPRIATATTYDSGGRAAVDVYVWDAGGVARDELFGIVVLGE